MQQSNETAINRFYFLLIFTKLMLRLNFDLLGFKPSPPPPFRFRGRFCLLEHTLRSTAGGTSNPNDKADLARSTVSMLNMSFK